MKAASLALVLAVAAPAPASAAECAHRLSPDRARAIAAHLLEALPPPPAGWEVDRRASHVRGARSYRKCPIPFASADYYRGSCGIEVSVSLLPNSAERTRALVRGRDAVRGRGRAGFDVFLIGAGTAPGGLRRVREIVAFRGRTVVHFRNTAGNVTDCAPLGDVLSLAAFDRLTDIGR